MILSNFTWYTYNVNLPVLAHDKSPVSLIKLSSECQLQYKISMLPVAAQSPAFRVGRLIGTVTAQASEGFKTSEAFHFITILFE